MRILIPLASLWLLATVSAQSVLPPFNSTYQVVKVGGGLGNYGGVAFAPGNPNSLLVGIYNTAAIRSLPLVRNVGGQIISFGNPTSTITVGGPDGGLAVGPNSVLFATWYGPNRLSQVKPGSLATDRVDDLGPLGIGGSVGTCAFVPAGLPGAGRFKICSWSASTMYDVPLTPDGNGTFAPGTASNPTTVVNGPEGLVYVPASAPLIGGKLLVSEWNSGNLVAYDIDANGDPLPNSRTIFAGGMLYSGGGAVDPVTGDILFINGSGEVVIVRLGTACGTYTGYGIPSPGALGTPSISGTGCARIGQSITIDTTGPANGLGIIAAGYQITATYLNLTVLQSLGVTVVSVLPPTGIGHLALTIPNDPLLGYSHLYLQAAYFDASTASGLIASAGLDLLIR